MRNVSILIPYKKKGEALLVYLQKRSEDAKRLPGYFGFWGGGAEGDETPKETLKREIYEEMGIDVEKESAQLFYQYTFWESVKNIYLMEVSSGWEDRIKIGEGDFGKWFDLEDVPKEEKIILEEKVILNDLERSLLKKKIR